jgi:hypothetical protein
VGHDGHQVDKKLGLRRPRSRRLPTGRVVTEATSVCRERGRWPMVLVHRYEIRVDDERAKVVDVRGQRSLMWH